MARTRLLPSDMLLKRMVDRGMTHAEIGAKYGTTRQAVATALSRAGLTDPHRAETVPWVVKTRHHKNYNMRMLRAHDRVLREDPTLSDEERHRHDLWLARLNDDDVVVDYNPDFEEGFYFTPRRPGIDLDVFRVPDVKSKKTVTYLAGLAAPLAPLYTQAMNALVIGDGSSGRIAAHAARTYVWYKYGMV